MAMGFVLSRPAQEDLTEISEYYLREAGTAVALKMLAEFKSAFDKLSRHPGIGHTREDLAGPEVLFFPVRTYLIVYRRGQPHIEVIGVLHAARDVPRILGER